MPYIERNNSGDIIALTQSASHSDQEHLMPTHADVIEFLAMSGESSLSKHALAESDADVARVTEDLIHLLVQKNHILFTDLPEAVQTKLLGRAKLRSTLGTANNSFLDDSESL